MLIKIVKSLGCAYGCGEGHRGLSGDRLRMQVGLTPLPRLTPGSEAELSKVMRSSSCSDLNVFVSQAQNCLTSLYKLDRVQFRQTMREYVNKDSLNNIVDFLHALLGFCMEPITDSKYVECSNRKSCLFTNNTTTGMDAQKVIQ